MNRLKMLRNQAHLTTRKLGELIGIQYSVITYLESNKRPFRESHIKLLSEFFDVTADFLLGKSDRGYHVYTQYGDDELYLTETEYRELSNYLNQKIILLQNPKEISNISSVDNLKLFSLNQTIYRELKGKISDYDLKPVLVNEMNNLMEEMDSEQIKKAIKLIKEIIL